MTRIGADLTSPEHTARLAGALAGLLREGDVLLLTGELGAGKTTFVRAFAAAAGVEPGRVSSPTFTVMHEYEAADGRVIVHADAYRLAGDDPAELDQLGWDRAASGDALVLVEWGERIDSLLDQTPGRLTLRHAGESSREMELEVPGAWADRPAWRGVVDAATGRDTEPGYPFASEREQLADLYKWFNESYRVSRPVEQSDLEAD